MIVAIDFTAAPPGEVSAELIELIATLGRPGSPARQRVVFAREEHRIPLRHATHGRATILTLDRTDADRQSMADYRRRKMDLLRDHGVQLLHAVGGPLDLLDAGVPTVASIDGLTHCRSPQAFAAADRGELDTRWTASAFRADTLIVPSAAVRDTLHRQLGVNCSKVFVAPIDQLLPTLVAAYGHATRAQPLRKAA